MFWEIKSVHAALDLLKGHESALYILLVLGGVLVWKKLMQRLNGKDTTASDDMELIHQNATKIQEHTTQIAVVETQVTNIYTRLNEIHKAVLRIETYQISSKS